MAEPTSASPGPDGRVLLSYGTGLPTIVCAPLRVCMIELQPSEKLVGEPHIGNSVRWNISPALYGQGESTTSIIVLKPLTQGLDRPKSDPSRREVAIPPRTTQLLRQWMRDAVEPEPEAYVFAGERSKPDAINTPASGTVSSLTRR